MSNPLLQYLQQALEKLDNQAAELQGEFAPYLNCRRGCSSCCEKVSFKVSPIEAKWLLEGISSLSSGYRDAIRQNLLSGTMDCPLLLQGVCAAYHYRPALCRAYGHIVQVRETLGTCSLNFNDVPDTVALKKLDLTPYYDLFDELSAALPDVDDPSRQTIRDFLNQDL